MSAIFTAEVAPNVCWKQSFFGQCRSPRIIMRMTIGSTPPRFWIPWCIVMLVANCFLHLFCPQVTCGQPCGQFIPLALYNASVCAHSLCDGVLVESVRCSTHIMKTNKDLSICYHHRCNDCYAWALPSGIDEATVAIVEVRIMTFSSQSLICCIVFTVFCMSWIQICLRKYVRIQRHFECRFISFIVLIWLKVA